MGGMFSKLLGGGDEQQQQNPSPFPTAPAAQTQFSAPIAGQQPFGTEGIFGQNNPYDQKTGAVNALKNIS